MSKKKKIGFLVCFLVVVAVCVSVFLLLEKKETPSTAYRENEQDDVVVYNGNSYRYNEHLSNYLFLGIDTREMLGDNQLQTENGRADAVYLISYDRVKKTVNSVVIPRDTITNIRTYSVDGSDLGMTEDHITMQYMYGDGREKSCRLMMEAISNLLYGIPIQGYCAVNMDGIPVAVGTLGSVEVVVPNASLEKINPQYQEETQITVTEENAEQFVRYRDVEVAGSAIERTERQKVFIEAFMNTAKERVQTNKKLVLNMYEKLEPYMVTNMDADLFVQLFDATDDTSTKFQDIPGKSVIGNVYDEYHIEESELYELVLQKFYQEVQGD